MEELEAESPILLQPIQAKGTAPRKDDREIQKTCLGSKLVLTEHFSSGEKWEHRAEKQFRH